jgi:hypothetical protein
VFSLEAATVSDIVPLLGWEGVTGEEEMQLSALFNIFVVVVEHANDMAYILTKFCFFVYLYIVIIS